MHSAEWRPRHTAWQFGSRRETAVCEQKNQTDTYIMSNFAQKAVEYYTGARQRARRRRSAWNALLIPFCFGSWLAIWCGLFSVVWLFHVSIYPDHQLRDFWHEGISFRSFVLSFLMVFALAPVAMIAGFMLGNSMLWLIAPIRRIFEKEASDYPSTSFRASMRGLFKFGVWVFPIGLAISFLAAYFLSALR